MKTCIGFTPLAVLVMVMASCGTYEHVYSSYDRSIDFSKYQTFAWIPDSAARESNEFANTAFDNDIIRNNAKNYINHLLSKRGYLVSVDSPDMLVQLVLLNERKEKIETYRSHPDRYYYYNNHFYYPYYYPYYRFYTWYGWNYPPFWYDGSTTITRTYVKGTITVNLYDRKLKRLIWTGSAEGDIYDPSYINHDVHPAIDKIMDEFPGKVKPEFKDDTDYRGRIVRANGNEERLKLTSGK